MMTFKTTSHMVIAYHFPSWLRSLAGSFAATSLPGIHPSSRRFLPLTYATHFLGSSGTSAPCGTNLFTKHRTAIQGPLSYSSKTFAIFTLRYIKAPMLPQLHSLPLPPITNTISIYLPHTHRAIAWIRLPSLSLNLPPQRLH